MGRYKGWGKVGWGGDLKAVDWDHLEEPSLVHLVVDGGCWLGAHLGLLPELMTWASS